MNKTLTNIIIAVFAICPNCHNHGYTKKKLWRNLRNSDNLRFYHQKINDSLNVKGIKLNDCVLKLECYRLKRKKNKTLNRQLLHNKT